MTRSIVQWILRFTRQNRASRAVVLTLIYIGAIALCFSGSIEANPRVDTGDFLEDSIVALIIPLVK